MGLFSSIIDAFSQWRNRKSNEKIAKQNLKAQQDNLEWQKMVQKETWAREDNAIQRQVADYQKAGFNKLMAVGGAGAGAGAVVPTEAPQQAQQDAVRFNDFGDSIGNIGQTIMNAISMKHNIAQTDANTKLLEAQEKTEANRPANVRADSRLKDQLSETEKKKREKIDKDIDYYQNLKAKTDAEKEYLISQRMLADEKKETEKYNRDVSKYYGDKTTENRSDRTKALEMFIPGAKGGRGKYLKKKGHY